MSCKSSDSEEYGIPPELEETAHNVKKSLLPIKSKTRYEKAYQIYRSWCHRKNTTHFGSQTTLLAYFGKISKEKKPSTLWTTYSMLRTMIELKDKKDISKYAKLTMFLKRQNVGFKPKKSSVCSRHNIDDFLTKAPLLPVKVALIITVSGACRSDTLLKMKVTDINILEEKILIQIPDTKTYRSRSLMVTEPCWVNMVKKIY